MIIAPPTNIISAWDWLAAFAAGKRQRNPRGKSLRNSSGKRWQNTATNTTCCCAEGECCDVLASPFAITSIARSADIATVTTPSAHGLNTTKAYYIRISGANESAYNGDFRPTRIDNFVFTYHVAGAPSTPATGTIAGQKVTPRAYFCDDLEYTQPTGCVPNSYLASLSNLAICTGCRQGSVFGEQFVMSSVPSGSFCMTYAAETGPPEVLTYRYYQTGFNFGDYFFDDEELDCSRPENSVVLDTLQIEMGISATTPTSTGNVAILVSALSDAFGVGVTLFSDSYSVAGVFSDRDCQQFHTFVNDITECPDPEDGLNIGASGGELVILPCC